LLDCEELDEATLNAIGDQQDIDGAVTMMLESLIAFVDEVK
jgi:hypothetical protein